MRLVSSRREEAATSAAWQGRLDLAAAHRVADR